MSRYTNPRGEGLPNQHHNGRKSHSPATPEQAAADDLLAKATEAVNLTLQVYVEDMQEIIGNGKSPADEDVRKGMRVKVGEALRAMSLAMSIAKLSGNVSAVSEGEMKAAMKRLKAASAAG